MAAEKIAGEVVKKTAEKLPSWLERVLVSSLNEIGGELRAVNTRIDSTNERIDSMRNETKTEFGALGKETRTEIESLRKEMRSKFEGVYIKITTLDERIISVRNETKSDFAGLHYRFDSLEKRIPVIEEITALKLRIAEMEKKLATA
jgi:hypothetical protein